MTRTKIEWATHTWNPIKMRCTPVSAGCKNCWHLRFAKRHASNPMMVHAVRDASAGGPPFLDQYELEAPERLRAPARIAVQLMGDLFHDAVPDKYIDAVFATMAHTSRHIFQILTKRPARMLEWISSHRDHVVRFMRSVQEKGLLNAERPTRTFFPKWPLPNVWMGTSAEDQRTWDERTETLRCVPAAIRWVSLEPQLGEVTAEPWTLAGLDWVIQGGESGPGARPFDVAWARDMRDACHAAGVKYFLKQLGADPILDHRYNRLLPGARRLSDKKGGNPVAWPEDLRVREFPAGPEAA